MENFYDNREDDVLKSQYNDPNASYTSSDYRCDNAEYNTNHQQNHMDTTPMSMGDWVLTILALFIPCAGVIIYLIWAFGKKGNVNRRNYCRAYLAIYAVIMAVYLLIALVFGAVFAGSI